MENLPSDHFITERQFVRTVYRDVYPAIDPTAPSNSQKGKVIVITGASQGIGRKVFAEAAAADFITQLINQGFRVVVRTQWAERNCPRRSFIRCPGRIRERNQSSQQKHPGPRRSNGSFRLQISDSSMGEGEGNLRPRRRLD